MRRKNIIRLLWAMAAFLLLFVSTFLYSRSWQNALFIKPLHSLETTQKLVALTFDDGPSTVRTLPLLALLKKHNVKATFFMLGENIEKHPEIAKEVFKDGHLIGNHSYNHPRLVFKSPAFVRRQIEKTDTLIQQLGRTEVKYFRPPFSSKYIVLPYLLWTMNKTLVTGTYDPPAEYAQPYPAEKVANQVVSNISNGAIIYLHDGKSTDKEAFLKSVELIIIRLKEKGYQFVRLDQPK
jgi:chitin deacetylase